MRRKIFLYDVTLLLLTVLLSSCSAEQTGEVVETQAQLGDAVEFTSNFGRGATRAAPLDDMWFLDAQVSICDAVSQTVMPYKVVSIGTDGTASLASTATSPNSTNTFYWGALDVSRTFRGWYPYSASLSGSISVSANQSTLSADAYQNQDILYAPDVVAPYKSLAELHFYHQLCRVVVTVNSSTTENSKPVTAITLGSGNISLSGTISTWGATGTSATGTATVWNVSPGSSNIVLRQTGRDDTNCIYTFECLLPPQSGGSTETALFNITTTEGSNQKTSQYKDTYNFQAGRRYQYNLVLSAQGALNVTTVQVTDWATESLGNIVADVPIGY